MQDAPERLQRVYELLGAPSLLYRHQESYTLHDEAASGTLNASDLAASLSSLQRTRTRWYYPVDYHVVKRMKDPAEVRYMEFIYKAPKKKRPADEMNNDSDSDSREESALEGLRRVTIQEARQALDDWGYLKEQSFHLQQEARLDMLLESEDVRVEERDLERKAQRLLRSYQRYDASYAPLVFKYRKQFIGTKEKPKPGYAVPKVKMKKLKYCSQERNLLADPAYLAPFGTAALEDAVKAENDYRIGPPGGKRRQVPAMQKGDHNSPEGFGNCILSFPCPCSHCLEKSEHTWCLLHPVGPVLDRVRLSHISLSHGRKVDQVYLRKKWIRSSRELNVGDSIRQVVPCGPRKFVVRTKIHCTVFKVTNGSSSNVKEDVCCGDLRISDSQRLDFRSLSSAIPSYFPLDVACHPKYGNDLVDPKLAIVCETNCKERNIIHHVLASPTPQTIKHVIANLQDIYKIDFATHHPMVLWAAARSHVRPALKTDLVSGYPSVGHGSSLYSIDLRSNQGAFQWSPSAEESLVEGIHSISGIVTDWSKDNIVLVSSISAGKTWEIDARMPCRSINSWSLPYSSDGGGPYLPASGLHGTGTLLAQPVHDPNNNYNGLLPRPIFSVGTSTDTFGIHLYQRPDIRPRFQTPSIECAAVPGLPFLGEMSVATSSIYPLPDVSDKVFTCGLTCFRAPLNDVLLPMELSRIGYSDNDVSSVLCAISMTNKGDLYTHTLLESKAAHKQSRTHRDLPLGTTALTVSEPESSSLAKSARFVLPIQLCNEFPIPSRAIIGSASGNGTESFDRKEAKSNDERTMSESSDEESMSEIRSNPTKLVVAKVSQKEQNSVKLKSSLVDQARTQLETTLDCFDLDRKSAIDNRDLSHGAWRSDITPGVLAKAKAAWDADSDDESL